MPSLFPSLSVPFQAIPPHPNHPQPIQSYPLFSPLPDLIPTLPFSSHSSPPTPSPPLFFFSNCSPIVCPIVGIGWLCAWGQKAPQKSSPPKSVPQNGGKREREKANPFPPIPICLYSPPLHFSDPLPSEKNPPPNSPPKISAPVFGLSSPPSLPLWRDWRLDHSPPMDIWTH